MRVVSSIATSVVSASVTTETIVSRVSVASADTTLSFRTTRFYVSTLPAEEAATLANVLSGVLIP